MLLFCHNLVILFLYRRLTTRTNYFLEITFGSALQRFYAIVKYEYMNYMFSKLLNFVHPLAYYNPSLETRNG